jgi:hypothetical protein
MNNRRLRPFFHRLSLVLISTALTLLLLEGFLRVLLMAKGRDIRHYQPDFAFNPKARDRSRFTSHPFLPYAQRPFDSRKLSTYREEIHRTIDLDYTLNSFGFRTPERPFEKATKVKRVITLGGSTTFDGPTNDQTWSAILETKLNEYYKDTGFTVEVINLAMDAAASPTSLINLEFIGLQYAPDLVINYDGVNDSILIGYEDLAPDYHNAMDKFDENRPPVRSRMPPWMFRSYLLSIGSAAVDILLGRSDLYAQLTGKKLLQLRPANNEIKGIEYFERNLKLMRAISGEYHARFVAATAHWVHPGSKIQKMNAELRAFFSRENIGYLDLDQALPHDDWTIHVDQVHWTLKGENDVSDKWKEQVTERDLLELNGLRPR